MHPHIEFWIPTFIYTAYMLRTQCEHSDTKVDSVITTNNSLWAHKKLFAMPVIKQLIPYDVNKNHIGTFIIVRLVW